MSIISLFKHKNECCACEACANSCPKSAINMLTSDEGFLYPVIDENLCVNCGLCTQVCNYQNGIIKESLKETYVATAKNTDLKKVASGGMFTSLAKEVLKNNGIVYGSAMEYTNEKLVVHHVGIDKLDDLYRLQGSKYVHSRIGDLYKEIKNHLELNRIVLFSGTPCQVGGLKGYLRKEYKNLFTIDIICHGVPSEKMFQDYITFEESKINKNILSYKFRDKSEGWKLYGKILTLDNNGNEESIYFEPEESSYYQMFLNSYTYRENCYNCPYAGTNRAGDITIGDYWCVELVHPELITDNGGNFDVSKGISCLIVNNEKGKDLLEKYGNEIMMSRSTFEQASKYNGQLRQPSLLKPERKIVFELYSNGYKEVEEWYQKRLKKIKFNRSIRKAVPKPIKKFLRGIITRCN